jgi:hypothetical protein
VDLEHLLVSLYVLVDEWWQETHPPTPKKAGRPPSLSASEVLTLAVLAQWPSPSPTAATRPYVMYRKKMLLSAKLPKKIPSP